MWPLGLGDGLACGGLWCLAKVTHAAELCKTYLVASFK
jgi:hypothetical protein